MANWILNAYAQTNPLCTVEMLVQKKAAAYEENKEEIEKLNENDIVFLYQNKVGIIAVGKITGGLIVKDYITPDGDRCKAGEYYKELCDFITFKSPFPYNDLQLLQETGKELGIRRTLSRLSDATATVILKHLWGITTPKELCE